MLRKDANPMWIVIQKKCEKYLWNMEFHYGDWLTPSLVNEDGSPNPMLSAKITANQVATMYFAYSTQLLSEISNILGKDEESKYYKDLSSNIKLNVLKYSNTIISYDNKYW